MKSIKLFLIILLLSTPLLGYADNNYNAWKRQALAEFSKVPIDEAGTITFAYGRDTPEMRSLVSVRTEEAYSFTIEYGSDPVLWWLLGELAHRKQLLYHIDLKKTGKPYRREAPENQALIKEYQSYYRKALDLDDSPDAPAHLDHEMLTAIGTDVLAAPDLKERAMKKKMLLIVQGDVLHENQEWQAYEFLLGNYAEQKDYDNYLKTVNEMIEKFPGSSQMSDLLENKRQAEAAIEKRDREAASAAPTVEEVNAQAEPAGKVMPAAQVAEETQKPESANQEPAQSELNLWLLLGGGFVLLGLIVFFMRRRNQSGL